jgi:transcriptional regulator GlxA family with amidase domain
MMLVLLVNHYTEFGDSEPILTRRQRELERLRAVFEFIEAHYMNEISVDEAARSVNMSKSHFMRIFRQVAGQPFVTHLNQFRIAKAQQLLATTDRTIADIGQEVGFCNQSYFGLIFRRLTGSSPKEYKLKLTTEVERHVDDGGLDDRPRRPIARAG